MKGKERREAGRNKKLSYRRGTAMRCGATENALPENAGLENDGPC